MKVELSDKEILMIVLAIDHYAYDHNLIVTNEESKICGELAKRLFKLWFTNSRSKDDDNSN